ncbi:MMPL family transporter [Solirubrobacter taibaiensis]|nr:MMPL family transporter [Solirubrobacter taibaiensis]
MKPSSPLSRLGGLAHRRRGRMVLAWVVALVAVIALAPLLSKEAATDFSTPNSESERVEQLLASEFPGRTGDVVTVAWEADDAAAQLPRIEQLARDARGLEGVGELQPARYSRDGTIGVAQLTLSERGFDIPITTGEGLVRLADATSDDDLTIALGGNPIQEVGEGGGAPESFGLMAAALILLLAFGSVVAAGLPLAVALFGLGISASLIGVLANFVGVPDFAPAVAGLIGIGVGVDYALLILTRFRTALDDKDVREAVIEAVETAGRSVLIAGTTVLISVNGLFLMGVDYLRGVALATSLAVLVVMAAAVTLLPALLAFAGRRVDRLRIPGLGRSRRTPAATWARAVQRRPVLALVLATAAMLALTAPIATLQLGFPDASNDTEGSTTRTAYDLVSRGFGPGANGPLVLAGPAAAVERVDVPGLFVSDPQVSASGESALRILTPSTAPQAQATTDLVHRLRDELPEGVMVGGTAAALADQSELVAGRLPLFIAGVVSVSFLLLLYAFRSPLIALKAGAMNLLSVGAAYGVIALFAQGGFFGGLIGIETATPVAPFIPVMMFAILFGLSMDYEVFLLSRVREEYLRHGDTSRAVAEGLARTARVITAAAAIMVAVFLAFVTSGAVFLKLLGIGMATAILVDATIVRMVLVPALMQLFGKANWWAPKWLGATSPRSATT